LTTCSSLLVLELVDVCEQLMQRLQLNTKKTSLGLQLYSRKSRLDKDIQVGPDIISPSTVVCDFGVFFHSQLRQETTYLVSEFVVSRLDYCCAVLAKLLASSLAPLEQVMHAAA